MTGLISKWLINDFRDPASMESWLSDMAKQGLLLRRISGFSAYFEKTIPFEMEYRVILSKGGVSNEQLARYYSMGWALVCIENDHIVIAAPSNIHPSEAYFGEVEERAFKKYSRQQLIGMLVAAFIMTLPTLGDLCSFHGPGFINWRHFFEGRVMFCTLLLSLFFGVELGIVAFGNRRRYIKDTKTQGTVTHHCDWKAARKRSFAIVAVATGRVCSR